MNIWKFALEVTDRQRVAMPAGAKILTVQVQGNEDTGRVCLWALVEPENEREDRRIVIVGTGHDYGGSGEYIGTIQLAEGRRVFHVFEDR